MSRLEGIAKAQFYPTPPTVVGRVAALVCTAQASHRRVVRLLDPCCGTGDALRQFTDAIGGGETYGIEVEQARASVARDTLDHVITGSAFAVRIANEAFSALWLNPPYDQDDGGRRLEHSFLTSMSRTLVFGGMLVYIVPQARLAQSARYLSAHYEDLHCYRFQNPEFSAFRQCVLLGRKRKVQAVAPELKSIIDRWSVDELAELPEMATAEPVLDLPTVPGRPVIFASQFVSPEEAAAEARERGLWANPALSERLWPAEGRTIRPLMPLRRGHLAVMVAAGFLNDIVLDDDGHQILVKGRVTKVSRSMESADPNVEVEREFLRTSVVMLDLKTGVFEDIGQGGEPAETFS